MTFRSVGRIVPILLAIAAALALPGVAQATPTTGAKTEATGVTAAAGSECYITRGNYVGGTKCGTGYYVRDYTWPDLRRETFIIGWDNAMWHIWQRSRDDEAWSGWASLGGGFTRGAFFHDYPDNPNVVLYGYGLAPNNDVLYCKKRTPVGWSSNWYSIGCPY